jgi:SynChlorMet cassette protein ScmC
MNTVCLRLANGSSWGIAGRDHRAETMVARLAETMQFRPADDHSHNFFVTVRDDPAAQEDLVLNGTTVECTVGCALSEDMLASRLQHLSQIIGLSSQDSGGLLLHGALIEKDGEGVILAGHGGAGKTTASQRVPAPWRSLCDDTTLIVRDGEGSYRAHPWPTWSSFMFGGPGGSWPTERSASLRGIFVLEQASEDRADPLGRGEAVCLLTECAEQVTWPAFHSLREEKSRFLRAQRFNNICDMTQSVPAFRLRLSLTGTFWDEIERVL